MDKRKFLCVNENLCFNVNFVKSIEFNEKNEQKEVYLTIANSNNFKYLTLSYFTNFDKVYKYKENDPEFKKIQSFTEWNS